MALQIGDHVPRHPLVCADRRLHEKRVGTDIENVLGRPATAYADWAERTIAAFR